MSDQVDRSHTSFLCRVIDTYSKTHKSVISDHLSCLTIRHDDDDDLLAFHDYFGSPTFP